MENFGALETQRINRTWLHVTVPSGTFGPQGLGTEEEEEEVPLRIEKVIKKVRINRKSHSN